MNVDRVREFLVFNKTKKKKGPLENVPQNVSMTGKTGKLRST